MTRQVHDEGYVTVVAGVSVAVVLSMGVAVAGLADVVAARHAVASAADLAAVAAGSEATAYASVGTVCRTAAHVAALGKAELVACRVTPGGEVSVRLRRGLAIPGLAVSAQARAGPAAATTG